LPGISSTVRFNSNAPALAVMKVDPENTDPSDILTLKKFNPNKRKQQREYITAKAKVGANTAISDEIPISFKRISPGYYLILTDSPLAPGEYAFTTEKFFYAFGID